MKLCALRYITGSYTNFRLTGGLLQNLIKVICAWHATAAISKIKGDLTGLILNWWTQIWSPMIFTALVTLKKYHITHKSLEMKWKNGQRTIRSILEIQHIRKLEQRETRLLLYSYIKWTTPQHCRGGSGTNIVHIFWQQQCRAFSNPRHDRYTT